MNNIEYNRNVNLDKVSTHNLDKILHSKMKSVSKMRVPSKREIYDEIKDTYKNAWRTPGFLSEEFSHV